MLILASSSPARRSLLAGTGLDFESSPALLDERAIEAGAVGTGAGPEAVARLLAETKAREVSRLHPGAVVIGADQMLAFGDELLHKPRDLAEARHQLDRLRGRTHRLLAGLALARDGIGLWSTLESASLTMRTFSDAEREQVLALEGDAVLSAVGAYRLEGPSIRLFERIEGDYFTILGLPLLPLLKFLRSEGAIP